MNEQTYSYLVISNDNISKKLKIFKTTTLTNVYQEIINFFPQTNNIKFELFYYEGYYFEKLFIRNEEDFVKAMKKNIEYLYFFPKYSNNYLLNEEFENYDYLKYHSVIMFSPIQTLNSEKQKEEMKKMKIYFVNKYID